MIVPAVPICIVCGERRSYGSAARCRACYRADRRTVLALGIGRGDELEIQAVLTLRGNLALALTKAAGPRGRDPAKLLADIIETVLGEGLINAVLDDA